MATNLHLKATNWVSTISWEEMLTSCFSCCPNTLISLISVASTPSDFLSHFVRFADQPNQTATQLPRWKCFQKSFAKVIIYYHLADENRMPALALGKFYPWIGAMGNHQVAPWTWCRAVQKIHAPTGSNYSAPKAPSWTMQPGVIGNDANDGSGDL